MLATFSALADFASIASWFSSSSSSSGRPRQAPWPRAIFEAMKANCRPDSCPFVDEFRVGFFHERSILGTQSVLQKFWHYTDESLVQWSNGLFHSVVALNPAENKLSRLMMIVAWRGLETLHSGSWFAGNAAAKKVIQQTMQRMLIESLSGKVLDREAYGVLDQTEDRCFLAAQQYWAGVNSPFEEIYGTYMDAICEHMKGRDVYKVVNPIFDTAKSRFVESEEGLKVMDREIEANTSPLTPLPARGDARVGWDSLQPRHTEDLIVKLHGHLWRYLNDVIPAPRGEAQGFWDPILSVHVPAAWYKSPIAPQEFWDWLGLPAPMGTQPAVPVVVEGAGSGEAQQGPQPGQAGDVCPDLLLLDFGEGGDSASVAVLAPTSPHLLPSAAGNGASSSDGKTGDDVSVLPVLADDAAPVHDDR